MANKKKLNEKVIVKRVIVAVMSAGISMSAAMAKKDIPPMEKCYGIVKAGKNDCGVAGENACAAQVKQNSDPRAWIFLPKGTCDKIVGGSTSPQQASPGTLVQEQTDNK